MLPRRDSAAVVLDGPTTVIDLGGLRIVSDPTFDDAGPSGYLTKLSDAKVTAADLGAVDVVLVSHDQHPDNLDVRGRAFALAAPLVLTTAASAPRLGPLLRGPRRDRTRLRGSRAERHPAVGGPRQLGGPARVNACAA